MAVSTGKDKTAAFLSHITYCANHKQTEDDRNFRPTAAESDFTGDELMMLIDTTTT